jgi:hypothetical protein
VDFNVDNEMLMAEMANCTVEIALMGAPLDSFRAILEDPVDVYTPYDASMMTTSPAITCLSEDFETIPDQGSLRITRDLDGTAEIYQQNGISKPDGAGFVNLQLTKV